MTSDQLSQVRDLIRQKKYDEARDLLQRIDDPKAAQWLARLNQMVPPPPPPDFRQAANAAPDPVKQDPAVEPAHTPEPVAEAAEPPATPPADAIQPLLAAEPTPPEPQATPPAGAIQPLTVEPAPAAPAAPPPAVEPEEVPAAATQVTKHKMLEARQMLLDSRFEEARVLLETLSHPTAQKWLATLNKKVPPNPVEAGVKPLTEITPTDAANADDVPVDEPPSDTIVPLGPPDRTADAFPSPPAEALTAPPTDDAKFKTSAADETVSLTAESASESASETAAKPADEPAMSASAATPAADPASPATAAPPAGVERVTAAMSDSDVLRLAQEALLNDQYDKARGMLEPLESPEAAFWLEKTGMTKFRSYENIWLDLFNYDVALGSGVDPDTWRCSLCSRTTGQALTCPQRGQLPCPVEFSERDIQEPRRLALLLQGLYLGQAQEMDKILGHIDPDLLQNWKTELEWQLTHMGQVDVRRPVVTAAIPLLGQYAEAKQAILDSQPIPSEVAETVRDDDPDAPAAASGATPPASGDDDDNVVGRVFKFIRKQVIS